MLSQQTPYTAPPIEQRPEMQPPPIPQRPPMGPEYNQQFIETLAQQLMPRLMPEIMYQLRTVEPLGERNRAYGRSLALAIVSVVMMIPLTAIVLGTLATAVGGGVGPALIGICIVGAVIVLINVLFNNMLFNVKS